MAHDDVGETELERQPREALGTEQGNQSDLGAEPNGIFQIDRDYGISY